MFKRKRWLMTLIVVIGVVVTGCMGGGGDVSGPIGTPKSVGDITGKVVDQDGKPLADVLVTIPNTVARSRTKADGLYQLRNIPRGTYKLSVTKPGYRLTGIFGDSNLAQGAVSAAGGVEPSVVLAQENDMAYISVPLTGDMRINVQLAEYAGGGNDVTVLNMTPPAHAKMSVGDEQQVELDVYYTVESTSAMRVVAGVLHGDHIAGAVAKPIIAGKGTVRLTVPFTVPNAQSLTLQVALADELRTLTDVRQTVFSIDGYVEPEPVRLQLDELTPSGIVLKWPNDYPDFASVDIYRVRSPRDDLPAIAGGERIATITDPTVTTFVDENFVPGDYFAYAANLNTIDGQTITGYDHWFVVHTLPMPDGVDLGWVPALTGLLYDATGHLLYAPRDNGQLTVLSPATRGVVDELHFGCERTTQHVLSADGSRLFYLCSVDRKLGVMHLPRGDVTVVDAAEPVQSITYDGVDDVVYVAVQAPQGQLNTYAIASDVGEWEALPLRAEGGLVVIQALHMLAVKTEANEDVVVFYDLSTLEEVTRMETGTGWFQPEKVQYDGRFLYMGTAMYTVPDFTLYGFLPGGTRVFTTTDDGRYWAGNESDNLTLSQWNGHAWSPIARFAGCATYGVGVQFGPNEVYSATPWGVCFVDAGDLME